jgi:UDP-2,3-diacylglucosamine hydrolase
MKNAGPLGIIAGNGRFPFLIARSARGAGRRVVIVGLKEEADPALAAEADSHHSIGLGQLGRCIALLKQEGVQEVVMAGQVKHRQIFSGIVPDLKLLGVLASLATKNTDSLIGGVAAVLAQEGITLLPSTDLLTDQLATVGAMTGHRPSKGQLKDIGYGLKIARVLAGLDLGQTVVIKDQAAVALEAMEGTDETVRRAGRLAGPGVTVVKVAKPRQDMRFDVPVVGSETLSVMQEVGATALAVEAGRTLLLDKPELLGRAETLGIAIWGCEA